MSFFSAEGCAFLWPMAAALDGRPFPRGATGAVYFAGNEDEGPIKIGFTADFYSRYHQLQSSSPAEICFLAAVRGDIGLERRYLRQFAAHRIRGEWFKRAPEIMAEIDRINAAHEADRAAAYGQKEAPPVSAEGLISADFERERNGKRRTRLERKPRTREICMTDSANECDRPEIGFKCKSWNSGDDTICDFLRLIEREVERATVEQRECAEASLSLNRQNLSEVGFQAIVLFTTPWDEEAPDRISLNDLLEDEAQCICWGDGRIHDDEHGVLFARRVRETEAKLAALKACYSPELAAAQGIVTEGEDPSGASVSEAN